jgi:hypothetical protein
VFSPGDIPSLLNVSPTGQRIVADLISRSEAAVAPAVSRKTACDILDVGSTKLVQLENAGELDSFLDGAVRRITTSSIYLYLIKRAISSHPADAPAAKVRKPKSMFKPKRKAPRARTEAELEGLRKGNEKRRLEAQERRVAAKEAGNTA